MGSTRPSIFKWVDMVQKHQLAQENLLADDVQNPGAADKRTALNLGTRQMDHFKGIGVLKNKPTYRVPSSEYAFIDMEENITLKDEMQKVIQYGIRKTTVHTVSYNPKPNTQVTEVTEPKPRMKWSRFRGAKQSKVLDRLFD